MDMRRIVIVRCKRCGHGWEPRVPDAKPLACPRCKRYDWNEDKK